MSAKSIVPRESGEGGLGRENKPWGSIYALQIPYIDEKIDIHNTNPVSIHIEGIQGNAESMTAFDNPVKINHTIFKGDSDIEILLANDDFMTVHEVDEIWYEVWDTDVPIT